MTYIEQHIVDHCKTADDVIKAAILVRQRRAALWPKIERTRTPMAALIPEGPSLSELITKSNKLFDSIERELCKIEISRIEKVRMEIEADPPQHAIKISDIHQAIARKFQITVADLKSIRRSHQYVIPRQVSFVLARVLTLKSYPEIGRRTGDRDHTTVLHGIRKYEWLRQKLSQELTIESPLSAWVNRAYELVNEK